MPFTPRASAPALAARIALLHLSVLLAPAALFAQPGAADASRPALAEPTLSPDSREIAFVSGADIWTVPAGGGEARLLVAHPAAESRPLYSPDGRQLAFTSTRTGNGDVYLLDLRSGAVKRLTFDDGVESVSAWSRDGRWLYFHSSANDISGMQDVYRVSSSGGTPMAVAADRYASEFFGTPSPDGNTLAISARGNASAQWWRHGRSHLDEAELWLVRLGATPSYTRLSEDGGSKDLWPMWSPDGGTVYYMSDRSGQENLWSRPAAGGAATRLTNFSNGRVLWPQLAYDGSAIVFERDFAVWHYEISSQQARAVPITLRGLSAARGVERVTLSQGFAPDLSPDGKKLALVARGELWAADAREGGEAARLSRSNQLEKQARWLRGGREGDREIVYVAWSESGGRLMVHDALENRSRQLTSSGDASQPTPSRDGRRIAYLRDGNALHVVNADGTGDRKLAGGLFSRAPFDGGRTIVWSPDNQWVAYLSRGERGFTNAYVVPANGGDARAVSFLGSSNSGALEWSPDGTHLLFLTSQRTEPARLVRVDLVPRTPRFREDRFRDLFTTPVRDSTRPATPPADRAVSTRDSAAVRAANAAATTSTRIDFDGIRERAQILSPGIDIGGASLTPDGKTLILTSGGGGQPNLYAWALDELAREPATPRQLTTTSGGKTVIGFSPDSRELWYLDAGRVSIVPVAGGAPKAVAISASLDADFETDKLIAFEQAWATQRDQFYDPDMHGTDWNAVRDRFAPVVRAARSPDEFRRLLSLMVGELNASHSGASGPAAAPAAPTGRLGMRFDREAYERDGTMRVQEVVRLGPAAIAGIAAGDRLTAVDGQSLARTDNLDSLLANAVDRKVTLTVSGPNGQRSVSLRPVSTGAQKQLLYQQWVEERRAYVAKVSNGRLGYVHMIDMGEESLAKLYLDLDAQNMSRDGVVIDMRNNNGGFVNAYALDVFARRPYMSMTTRGSVTAPARTQLGQRALEKPTVLVTNQHTLSDGEDFTQGYRVLGLGKVVGEPTAGWIVYTSNISLVDGTSLRVPFIRVDDHEGKNMELVPRPVDVPVTRPVGEHYRGVDSQLDTAVRVLLEQLRAAR
jgi:tricorn protease